MSNRTSAFTLIEVLVSVAIGSAIVAAAWASFIQVRQATVRSKIATVLHQDAAIIDMNFETALSTCFHGSQVRLSVSNPGHATLPATLTFDVMRSAEDTSPAFARSRQGGTYAYDLVWERFRYIKDPTQPLGTLSRATSTAAWAVTGRVAMNRLTGIKMQPDPYDATHQVAVWGGEDVIVDSMTSFNPPQVRIGPEVRRDRRRWMIDNDLRLWPNIPNSLYLGFTTTATGTRVPISDDEKLDLNLSLMSDKISAFRIELVDFQGLRTTGDPRNAAGLTYTDNAGSTITPPPAPAAPELNVWSSTLRVVDGLWTDGRADACPLYAAAKPPAEERPALVRIAFTLTDPQSVRHDPAHPISRDFSFTIATSSMTVAPKESP